MTSLSRQQRTILIIDDSPEDRELYRRYLLRDEEYSYTIWEAALGREGLELWQRHQPDAVLLDYRLPDLDGLEWLAQIPSQTQPPCLPVIVVTGQGNEAIAVRAMKAGAQDYLVKGQITPTGLQLAVNGAIATVQLRTQLQQQLERERVVAQITRLLHRSLDLDEILQTAVTQVRHFLQCDRVLIFRLHSEDWGTVVKESVATGWTPLLSSRLHDPCLHEGYIESFRQGLVTVKPDIYDGSIDPCHVELLSQLQVRANLVVPILQKDQLWGMLIAHECAAPRQWQQLEIDLLKELAIQVGIALQQAELYQQAQNELAERQQAEYRLRQSEERFRQLAENMEDVFWILELPERRVSYVSPAYQRLWGLNPQKLYDDYRVWIDSIDPEDREATEKAFQEQAVAGKFDREYRLILPDGTKRWIRDRCFPIRDASGRVYRLTGMAEDITERKQVQLNDRFLNDLDLQLRQLLDAEAMTWEMLGSLGQYLEGNYCLWGQIDRRQGLMTIATNWCRDLPSMAGTYSLSDFIAPEFQATMAAGQPAVVYDVTTDPRTAAFASNYELIQVQAFVSIPYIYRSECLGILAISSPMPRRWREDEVALLQETIGRLWSPIEQTRAVQALESNQAQLQQQLAEIEAIYQSAPIGLNVLDADLRFVRINQRLAEINGLPVEAHIGRTVRELLPDIADTAEQLLRSILETGEPLLNVEIKGETPAQPGVQRTWLEHFLPLKKGDRTIGISTVCEEITERIQAESALRQSEERFRHMADNAPMMVWVTDATGYCTYLSQSWYNFTGQTPSVGLGFGWLEAVHPEDREFSREIFFRAKELREAFRLEYRLRRHDGEYRWAIDAASPWFGPDGQFQGYIGSVIDISDRQQAEEALRQSEEFKNRMLQSSPDCIKVLDLEGRLEYMNTGGMCLMEIDDLSSYLNAKWVCFWEGEYQQKAQAALMSAKAGEVATFQGYCPTAKGTPKWWEVIVSPIFDGAGKVERVLSISRDITDRQQAEAERERLLKQEQEARAEAERANRIKDEFLAILSHELRSPLNPILGWVKLLQTRKFDAAKTQEALASIERNAKLQTQLIDDLLDIARILRGKLALNVRAINLGFILQSAMETVKAAANAKSIAIHPLLSDLGQVSGDPVRLQQIVWNLLSNAIKFTPSGGRVEIRLERVEGERVSEGVRDKGEEASTLSTAYAQITVSDTGKGISADFLPHIFEYFRQEDASITRKHGGLGLGLAIVHHLVEAHGGTISATSPGEGRGATFTVKLPLLGSQLQRDGGGWERELDLAGIRVLVVDDELDTRQLLAFILEEYGAEAMTVDSASAVLAQLESFQPDILLSDIGMPEVDGYTLISRVRSLPAERGGQVPAIALTAYAREEDREKALAAGFQGHISKPVDPSRLVAAIVDLLNRRSRGGRGETRGTRGTRENF
jgi:PAS domain S-box-containing protein